MNPRRWTGIIGQSSGRGLCVIPSTYHSTTSRLSIGRLAAVHFASRGAHYAPTIFNVMA